MPIDFQVQRQRLARLLSSDRASVNAFVQSFASWYDALVRSGQDATYGNTVATANRPGFVSALRQALQPAGGTAVRFQRALSNAVTQYWTGAALTPVTPPPGTGPVTSNTVINPGVFDIQLPPPQRDADVFTRAVTQAVQAHLLTVSGVTVSLTPSPGGPVPVTYPWAGYI